MPSYASEPTVARHGTRVLLPDNLDDPVSPDGMAPDASPPRGAQTGQELAELTFILHDAGKSTDPVDVAGARAAAQDDLILEIAAHRFHVARPLRNCLEIDLERPF